MTTDAHAIRFFKVCPFEHDHPNGEGFADCLAAFQAEQARIQGQLPDAATLEARRIAADVCTTCIDLCDACKALCRQRSHRLDACACGHDPVHEHAVDSAGVRYCTKCWVECQLPQPGLLRESQRIINSRQW